MKVSFHIQGEKVQHNHGFQENTVNGPSLPRFITFHSGAAAIIGGAALCMKEKKLGTSVASVIAIIAVSDS